MRHGDPRLTFVGTVKCEWVKLWALRSPKLVVIALVGVPVALGLTRALAAPVEMAANPALGAAAVLESVSLSALPVAFLAAMLGLLGMGAERTEEAGVATLLVAPRRSWLVHAKVPALVFWSVLGTASGVSMSAVLACVAVSARGVEPPPLPDLLGVMGGTVAGAAAFSLLGLAAAAFFRTTIAATAAFALIVGLLPSVVGALGMSQIADLQPVSAVQAAVTRAPATTFTLESVPASALPWWGGLLLLLGWSALAVTSAAFVFANQLDTTRAPMRRTRKPAVRDRVGIPTPTFGNVLRAELLKTRSMPTSWWLLSLVVIGNVAMSGLIATRLPLDPDPHQPFDGTSEIQTALVAGLPLAQLLVALFGTAVFTSDYASGVIRSTLVAAPRRATVHVAKLTTAFIFATATATAAVAIATPVVLVIAAHEGLHTTAQSVLIIAARLIGALGMIAVVGAAVGDLLRQPTAAVAAVVTILVIIPSIAGQLTHTARGTPAIWILNAFDLLPAPSTAANTVPPDVEIPQWLVGDVLQLTPDQSMVILIIWALTLSGIARTVFARRSM